MLQKSLTPAEDSFVCSDFADITCNAAVSLGAAVWVSAMP